MFWFGWILFSGIAVWVVPPVLWFVCRRLQPVLTNHTPSGEWPAVSVIVPARNEAAAIERALRSLLKSDYPGIQLLAVNDRSTDDTGAIMNRVASDDSRCQVIDVEVLPDGWLGKNHAMHLAAGIAKGEYLLFTDGDVIHEPAALRSAVTYLKRKRLSHLCLLPRMIPGGFFENCIVAFFGLAFAIGQQVHLIRTRWPFAYVGVGAFNLIDAEFYRSFGGHTAIAMDVIDDAKLGKLVKQHGGTQDFIGAPGLLSIRWYDSLWEVITGLEKNGFAALNYSLTSVMLCTVVFFATMMLPYIPPLLLPLSETGGFLATVLLWHVMYGVAAVSFGGSVFLVPFFPVAASLMSFAFWRSAWVTLRQDGVRWRNSFYSLDELRKGLYR
ncbi:MAG: glycosyltransferase [Fuerstiella sp.]|nr:glycosyltransferase [Fuerstiella sp.]